MTNNSNDMASPWNIPLLMGTFPSVWPPLAHSFFNEVNEVAIYLQHSHALNQPAMWDAVESFLVVDPHHAEVGLSPLAVSDYCLVS